MVVHLDVGSPKSPLLLQGLYMLHLYEVWYISSSLVLCLRRYEEVEILKRIKTQFRKILLLSDPKTLSLLKLFYMLMTLFH